MNKDDPDDGFDAAMDGDTTIAVAWKFFSGHALPEGCPPGQRDDMYYAFFAGCSTVFAKIASIMDRPDKDEKESRLVALADEVAEMSAMVGRNHLAGLQAAAGGNIIGRVEKIDPMTGTRLPLSTKEDSEMTEILRRALDKTGVPIVFDEKTKEDLKARGLTEDTILSMLATAIGHKQ